LTSYNPRLITPPKEEEEIYPYRRAWRSVFIESGILLGLLLIFFLIFNLLGLKLVGNTLISLNVLLAISPALLWVIFSRLPESNVVEPRRRLLTTFTVTALVANAVGVPLIENVFQPDAWLPLQSTLNRILGYTVTVGILQELLKYLVLRYIVWPSYYRVRIDAIAYGAASAVAYAMVINLNYIFNNLTAAPDVVMSRVFANLAVQLVGSIIVAFGLSETRFNSALSLFLPFMVVLAALLTGIAIPIRTEVMNASLAISISAQRGIFGLIFSIIFYVAPMAVMFFLFSITERRQQELIIGQEV
jgi:RsiW-degrading membrane proteinase PrsW (M82 family)